MKSEVKDRLVTGLSQYLGAQSAGASRFAIADGYLAMDNYFSGLLLEIGVEPSFNHKRKLQQVFDHFGPLFVGIGVEKQPVERFYNVWQRVRYSPENPAPGVAIQHLRLAREIMTAIRAEIAHRYGLTEEQIEEQLYAEVMGSRWSSFDAECSEIHEQWQMEAERAGEMGYGTKLVNKMLNPSNFSDVRVFADDEVTRKLIAEDPEFGSRVAGFYNDFLKLIMYLQDRRQDAGVEPGEVPNIMLALRLRYHGQNVQEVAEDWGRMVAAALSRSSASERKKQPPA